MPEVLGRGSVCGAAFGFILEELVVISVLEGKRSTRMLHREAGRQLTCLFCV